LELRIEQSRIIPCLEIYRAAKLLINQHGEDAPIRAVERVDELLDEGNAEGALVWRGIVRAIKEPQQEWRSSKPPN
jgi:hypothetical protein